MKFGFLTDKSEVVCNGFTISPLSNIDESLQSFYERVNVSNGWIYGPEVELKKSRYELSRFKQRGPIIDSSYYYLQATHQITTSIEDSEYLKFLILGYSFLQGVYLSPEGYLNLGKVPYKPGTLNGLILTGQDRVNGMEQINSFYKASDDSKRKQAFAILHWFLIAQTHKFSWEKFEAQYKVLDGLYRLADNKEKITHSERPVFLAEKYGVVLPDWAHLNSKNQSKLTILRNELVHEGKYAGQPIGYAHPEENYPLEFRAFNSKLICSALGIKTGYITAKPENRDMWAWDIAT